MSNSERTKAPEVQASLTPELARFIRTDCQIRIIQATLAILVKMQGPVISSAVIKELEGGFKIFDDRNGSLPGGASIDEEITAQLSMALKLMIKNINDFPLDHYDSETRSPDQTGK